MLCDTDLAYLELMGSLTPSVLEKEVLHLTTVSVPRSRSSLRYAEDIMIPRRTYSGVLQRLELLPRLLGA